MFFSLLTLTLQCCKGVVPICSWLLAPAAVVDVALIFSFWLSDNLHVFVSSSPSGNTFVTCSVSSERSLVCVGTQSAATPDFLWKEVSLESSVESCNGTANSVSLEAFPMTSVSLVIILLSEAVETLEQSTEGKVTL